MQKAIDDAISRRVNREYFHAEERAAYNWSRQNWELAERWARLADLMTQVADCICWDQQDDRADA